MKGYLFIILFLSIFLKSFSWGGKGHKMVASIARNALSKQVVDSVQYYLGDMSFEEASVWMDKLNGKHSYDYLKPMHYINIAKDKTYVKTNEHNIINELELTLIWLEKKESKGSVNFALKLVFHLIGDLHQPLHSGYLADRGGNDIKLIYKGNSVKGKKSNLHRVWDADMIDSNDNFQKACMAQVGLFTKRERDKMMVVNTIAWLNESRALLPIVYNFKNGTIEKDYIKASMPVIVRQVSKAGIRLAGVLNKYFKKK